MTPNMLPSTMTLNLLSADEKQNTALFNVDSFADALRLNSSPIIVRAVPIEKELAPLFFEALASCSRVTCTSKGVFSVIFKYSPNFSHSFPKADDKGEVNEKAFHEHFAFFPHIGDEALYSRSRFEALCLDEFEGPTMFRTLDCPCTLSFEALPVMETSDR